MKIIERFSTKNDCYQNNLRRIDSRYTTFQTRGPVGLMLHSVGVSQPDASVFAQQWDHPGLDVAVHAVAQADGTVYQCLPWNYRGWHAGGSANNTHIGVELTEPAEIRYTAGASFTVTDREAAREQCRGTYRTAVALFAKLCREFSIDPAAIVSHAEGSRLGIASQHADPEHLWRGLGLEYTMDGFRADVRAELSPGKEEIPMTKDEILHALGDRYIRTFADLPDWAKPEVREMLDRGFIDGGTPRETDPDDLNMLLSDLRTAIIAYRMTKG